jgi:Zn-dependent protease with chaperone function
MKYTPIELEENVNISDISPIKEFFVLLGGILIILISIYVVLGLTVDLIIPRIPRNIEQSLGSLFLEHYEIAEKTSAGKQLQELVDELAKGLPQNDPYQYNVYLVKHSQANAIALPGGNIVVFSGILKDVESENGLAFVLSHELGHFTNRDHLRGLGRGLVLLTFSSVLLGNDSFITDFLTNTLINVEMKFSQRQEKMADLFALDLLNKKYGHVGGAESFFKKICEKEKKSPLSFYFASHPHPRNRLDTMAKHIQKKGYQIEKPIPLSDILYFNP